MLGGKKSNNKKVEKLRTIFIKYLSLFFIMTISIVLLLMLSFSVLLSSGVILPANYAEKQFNKYKEQIISSEKVTEDIIPSIYEYGVYTLDGSLISGTFNKKESK